MADEQVVRPPDQVASGGMPAPPDTGGMVDALRSGGTPPAALSNIMQPPVYPQANVGSAIGSGGLSAMGGHPGANPYLSGLQQQQTSLFYQQLNQQYQALAVEKQRAAEEDRAFRKNATLMTIEKGVLDSLPEGPLRAQVAGSYAKKLSQITGNPLYGDLGAALATKKISVEDVNGIMQDGAQKMDPQLIALRHPNVPPQKIQQILQSDPKTLERLGADSDRVRQDKIVDSQIKQATLAEKQHPELKGDAKLVHSMLAAHLTATGKDYTQGTPESQAAAYHLAKTESEAREEKLIQMKSQADLAKAIELAQIRASITAQKPLTPMQKTKAIEPLARARGTMTAIDKLESIVDQMPEGVFPGGDNVGSQMLAKVRRATTYKNNSALQQFEQWWGPVSIGQIDRGMFDEKGVRAIQAFNKQVGFVDNLPPRQAVKDYLKTVRDHLSGKMGSDIGDMEDLGYPPDVVMAAKKIYQPYAPKPEVPGGTALPNSPLSKPADLVYDLKKGWITPGAK